MNQLLSWTCVVALLQSSSPIGAQIRSPPPLPPEVAVRPGGSVQPPQKTRHVEPIYPDSARAAGLTGVVIVELVIGTTGRPHNVRVLRSSPPFDSAAVNAVRQWRYRPTLLHGTPVPVILTISVQFRPASKTSPARGSREPRGRSV